MGLFLEFVGGIVCLMSFILLWGWWMNSYFRRRGVKSIPSYFPYVGNMMEVLTQTKHISDVIQNWYNTYPDEKYIGVMRFSTPAILITDLDLVKQVLIKDFDYFQAHHFTQNDGILFGKSLLSLDGQKWRDMRATLSPTFTGSKMRMMVDQIIDVSDKMTASLTERYHREGKEILDIEMKDVYLRCVNDVIAISAFGFNVNSFTDRHNKFYESAKEATDFSGLKFLLLVILPKVTKALGMKSLSNEVTTFFRDILEHSLKERKERNIARPDMLHLVMEALKGTLEKDVEDNGKTNEFSAAEEYSVGKVSKKRVWSEDEILPQLNVFIAGGLETSSNMASIVTHYLALNPHMQKRLQKEIDDVLTDFDGNLTYEGLHKMKYLDMVVSESLRFLPGAILTDRKCTKDYILPPPNGKSTKGLEVKAGDCIFIPIHAIHHDPRYFKDPETFDPERFSDENQHKIVSGSYIPFGLGPRNCIASRYGLMLVKITIINIFKKFDFVATSKTKAEIKLRPASVGISNANGYWLGIKPRLSTN